jgi:hypothetical protein
MCDPLSLLRKLLIKGANVMRESATRKNVLKEILPHRAREVYAEYNAFLSESLALQA